MIVNSKKYIKSAESRKKEEEKEIRKDQEKIRIEEEEKISLTKPLFILLINLILNLVILMGRFKMGKINEFFINLLQVYVYIAVIVGIFLAYNMGNQFGAGGYAVFMYILIVPLVFGLLLIQIDNNSLLRQIRYNTKRKM